MDFYLLKKTLVHIFKVFYMTIGHIHKLRTKLLSNHIRPGDVFNFFFKRIQMDRQAVESKSFLSSLDLTTTNSILDFVSSFDDVDNLHCLDLIDDLSLHAIPITIKDNFSVDFRKFKLRTTCASKSLSNFKSGYNAAVSLFLFIICILNL